jgi:hypothetical protein
MPIWERSSRARHRRDVDAVEVIVPPFELVEPHQQVHQRRLARAGGPDDGDGRSRLGVRLRSLDERLVRHVGELDVVELDPARVGYGQVVVLLGDLLVGIQHLEDPLGRRDARLQQVRHGRHLRDRLGEHPRVLDERLHVAQRHLARRHPQAADDGDGDVAEVPDEEHHRHHHAGEELGAEAGVYSSSRCRGEGASTSR